MCQVLLPLLQYGCTHFKIQISQWSSALAPSILAQLSLNTLPLEIQKSVHMVHCCRIVG